MGTTLIDERFKPSDHIDEEVLWRLSNLPRIVGVIYDTYRGGQKQHEGRCSDLKHDSSRSVALPVHADPKGDTVQHKEYAKK